MTVLIPGAAPTASGASINAATTLLLGDAATTITVAALAAYLGTGTATATAYTTTLSATTGASGSAVTITFTPTGGNWPASETITPTVSGVAGTFSPTTVSPSGSSVATVTFTPSATGTAALSSTTSPALTNTTGSQNYTVTAAPAAPNAVTSLAAPSGSITSSSVVLTWTESGGAPTTRTVSQRTPSGSGSYVASTISTGPTSTGATVSGLSASTSYDFQVVESNTTGTSSPAVLTNITTSAAAVTRPALTMTSATYGSGKTGFGQALTGGEGLVNFTTPAASRTLELWFNSATSGTGNLIVDSTAGSLGLAMNSGYANITTSGYTQGGGSNICDGAWHHLAVVGDTSAGTNNLYVDGVNVNSNNYGFSAPNANPGYNVSAAGTFTANNGGTAHGIGTIDEVRISNIARYTANFTPSTAPFTVDSNTLALYHLDGNGTSA